MEKEEELIVEEVENNTGSKRDVKSVFVTHSKEIISAVIVEDICKGFLPYNCSDTIVYKSPYSMLSGAATSEVSSSK